MRKILSLLSIVGLTGLSPVLAQTPDENLSSKPIVATLDSLTYLLHCNGFNKLCAYAPTQEQQLDFNPATELPEFPATLVQQRMNALGSEIPLEYNQYVKGFIDLYGRRKRELTSKILTLSDYYFPVFEQILDKNNLPLELKYLAVVESALNPRALSWAGASGPWQFIYSTGLLYDLEINSYVDERRDIYKSTEAACQYFKDSYALYGDWLLVIASYNCGPGNVNKAIRKSGGKKNFWAIQKFLPAETRGYVPAFIAVAYVMNYAKEHGIYPMNIEMDKVLESVYVEDWITFDQLASALKMPLEQIYELNPQYRKEIVPGNKGKVQLHLPYEKAMAFAAIKDSIYFMPMYDEEGNPYRYEISTNQVRYKVRKGDNLKSIANKYNVAQADIKEWNVIRRNRVVPGRYLTLYVEKKEKIILTDPALASKKPATQNNTVVYYEVKPGDTLYSISRQYNGMSVDKLRELNSIGPDDVLKPGTVLKIQEGG